MGIRGLTSYIAQNSDRFHQPYHLYDSSLVIDGSSLACKLYIQVSNCNSAFGGDYDKYAKTIEEFFLLLRKCNVTPYVILDGGYESRKLKTVWKRLKSKLFNAQVCNPQNQKSASVFPLLMWDVFKEVMAKLNVKFAQTDFEADQEIAAVSRFLNCPVLSYDSDFYVFDVKYIPFSTLSLSASSFRKNNIVKYYLSCQLYEVELFLSNFGGLDKSLLPLMATLLGNDYVPACIFSKFYNHVKLPKSKKMTQQQRRISAIFEWLRKETLPSAISKILNHLKKESRQYVKKQIELAYNGYSCSSSEVLLYLGLGDANSPNSVCASSLDLSTVEELESSLSGTLSRFPPWIRDKFQKGELPSLVSDIFHLKIYLCQPQVEDFTLNDSHALSFPILKVLCGLLFADDDDACVVNCFTRGAGHKPQKFALEPVRSLSCLPSFPSLTDLPYLSHSVRQEILYSSLGIMNDNEKKVLESFGDRWNLFALTVVFWARNAVSPNVTNCHLNAIVISMIALGVVDRKLGCIRSKKELLKRQRLTTTFKSDGENALNSKIPSDLCSYSKDSFEVLVRNVEEIDCFKVAESLLEFHLASKEENRNFSLSTVHVFAQLQACLLLTMSLNALLNYPLSQCNISETYSGTALYAAFANFNKRSSVEMYIKSLMSDSPSLLNVYTVLVHKFKSLLPTVPVLYRKPKRKKRRKQDKLPASDSSPETDVADSGSEDHVDVNNKFSVLNLL